MLNSLPPKKFPVGVVILQQPWYKPVVPGLDMSTLISVHSPGSRRSTIARSRGPICSPWVNLRLQPGGHDSSPEVKQWLSRYNTWLSSTSMVLVSRVSGCLLTSLVHEKYLILGKKTPLILVCVFFYKYSISNFISQSNTFLNWQFTTKLKYYLNEHTL